MTNEIVRLNIEPHNGGGYQHWPAPSFGKYVLYEDHERIVAELKGIITKLEEESVDHAWRNMLLLIPD